MPSFFPLRWTFCLGWPQATILLISAFQVVRIKGLSHQHLATIILFFIKTIKSSKKKKEAKEQSIGDEWCT
jgi:hypothetical protein